jgi:hypothetical protein
MHLAMHFTMQSIMFKCVHFSEYDKTDDVTPITVEEINIWKDAIMTYFKVLLP